MSENIEQILLDDYLISSTKILMMLSLIHNENTNIINVLCNKLPGINKSEKKDFENYVEYCNKLIEGLTAANTIEDVIKAPSEVPMSKSELIKA